MKCINVSQTGAHYGDLIAEGLKTVETRTIRAWEMIRKALDLREGDTVGVCCSGRVICTCTFSGVVEYASREEFRADHARHLVPEGSRFDWTTGKGKVGILLGSPVPCSIEAPRLDHVQGWRII